MSDLLREFMMNLISDGKLKDYEEMIENERKKTKNAENRIFKLKKEIELLQNLNNNNEKMHLQQ